MRLIRNLALGLVVLLIALAGYVFYEVGNLKVEEVTDDVHVIFGLGGNVGVLNTEQGTVIIDTMVLSYQGSRIQEIAESLTGKPVIMIVNTHYHSDHTHGNPAFDADTRVISTERTLHHLQVTDAGYFSGAAAELMPDQTFTESLELDLGNKTLRLVYPGRGHTDGDLIAIMVEDRVMHAGDLFFNGHYPNIDLEGGGSVQHWPATIDRILQEDVDFIIPGHGPMSDAAGLMRFQSFLTQLAEIGRWSKSGSVSLEETLASDRLTADSGFVPIRLIVPIGLDRPFVLRRAWEEANDAFELRD